MVNQFLQRLKKALGGESGHHFREILSGAAAATIMRVLGILANFAFSVLLARSLGPAGAGVFFLGLTIVMIASVIGRLGLDNAVIKFIAQHQSDQDPARSKAVWLHATLTTVGLTSFLALLIWLFRHVIAEKLFDDIEIAQVISSFTLAIFPIALATINAAALKGLKKTGQASFVNAVGRWALALPFLYFASARLGVHGAVVVFVAAAYLNWLWSWFQLHKNLPVARSVTEGQYSRLMSTAMPLMWISVMSLLTRWADSIMIGMWLDNSAVGLYNIAFRVAALISFLLMAVTAIAAPKFAELWHKKDMYELEKQTRFAALLVICAATPMFLIALLWPHGLLQLFGQEFVGASSSLQLLAVGQFVNAITGATGALLVMTGYEKTMRNIITGTAILNVLLNLVLIPQYGIVGASLAGAVSLAAVNLLAAFMVFRLMGIVPFPFLPSGIKST